MSADTRVKGAIGLVGAGSVARALGRLLYVDGEPVVALASRSQPRAEHAATFIGPTVRVVTCSELADIATRVLIAVSDEGITPVAQTLARAGMRTGVALHTCGARGPEALAPLQKVGVACGVLHPLQTVAAAEQGVKSLERISFGLAGDRHALDWAEDIVARLDGRSLSIAADRLPLYHAGATMAGNALIALIDAAVVLMGQAGVERQAALQAIGPLCRASLENALRVGPEAALTGPIARGDVATVAVHLKALGGAPSAVESLYRAAGRCLLNLARQRGLPEGSISALGVVLDTRNAGDADG